MQQAQTRIGFFGWNDHAIEERSCESVAEAIALSKSYRAAWIDVEGVPPSDFVGTIERSVRLVPLAADTLIEGVRRPGVDDFDDVLVVTMRSHLPDDSTEFIDFILTDGVVITLQERCGGDGFDGVRGKLRSGNERLLRADVNVVFLLLARAVCDGFRPVLERFQDSLERFERALVRRPDTSMLDRIHHQRRQLLFLRQGLVPLREALANMQASAPVREMASSPMRARLGALRELQDEIGALLDVVEFQRESSQHLLDLYLNAASNKLNEIVRVLTIISVIFMPMTLIAGIYGMNFEHGEGAGIPELRWKYGYWFALGLMAATALGFLYFFWRKGWIGDPLRQRRHPPSAAHATAAVLEHVVGTAWPLSVILARRRPARTPRPASPKQAN
ncbi:MAG: magnesium/cobalt transporter CorA [Planctomycetaceae bacterium]|nr:magnesium/cobalt transporter CorA [Planctomycetaceae bacterium]